MKSSTTWNGTDDFGFSAIPGGGLSSNGAFIIEPGGWSGAWWSQNDSSTTENWIRILSKYPDDLERSSYSKEDFYSVRCVKDISIIIELNDQVCPNGGEIIAQIIDGIGVVKTSPSTGINYIDYYKEYSDGGSIAAKLYPCNISNEQLIVGVEIKFSGIVYSKNDPDDITVDSDFAQIVISSAEYAK